MISIASAITHMSTLNVTRSACLEASFFFLMDIPMFLRSPHRHPFIIFLHFACATKLRRYLRGNFLPTVPHPFEKGNWIPRSHIRPPQQRWSLATWASGICSPGFSTDSNLELGWNPEALKNLGLSVLDILRHIELPKIPKSERFQETNLCT